MNLDLFKETKTRYLFLKLLSTLILTVVILVILKLTLKQSFKAYYFDFIPAILTLSWLVITISFLNKNNINISEFIGKPSGKSFVFEVPLALILTFMGGVGALLIIYFAAYSMNPSFFKSVNSTMIDHHEVSNTFYSVAFDFIGSVILAPVTEELLFRGILLNRLRNKFGIKIAVFLSSLIFMLCHLKPNPLLFFAGITCCILFYKYNSLIPSILLHFFNNLFVCLRNFNYSSGNNVSSDFSCEPIILVIGLVLLSFYIIYIYKNFPKFKSSSIDYINI